MLVDIRDPRAFGAGHVAGSLNVWVDGPQFAERVSWFVEPDRPLVLLADSEGEVVRALGAFARLGLDGAVTGYVVGPAAVRESGLPAGELPNVTAPEVARRRDAERDLVLLDVREPVEWADGHAPGALHIPMRCCDRDCAAEGASRGFFLSELKLRPPKEDGSTNV